MRRRALPTTLKLPHLKRAHEGSDALMVFLLKGLCRNKYVNYVEVDHAVAVQRTQDMAPIAEIMAKFSQFESPDPSRESNEQSWKSAGIKGKDRSAAGYQNQDRLLDRPAWGRLISFKTPEINDRRR